jgi:hypothetical protein
VQEVCPKDVEDAPVRSSMAALLDEGEVAVDGTVAGTVDGSAVVRHGEDRGQKIEDGILNLSFFLVFFNLPSVGTSANCRTVFVSFFFGQMRIFGECQ